MPAPTSKPACSICSQLPDLAYASQKYGWEEHDTRLPVAANQLVAVKDLKPDSSRSLILQQCPECGMYYLYQSDYEYLANGSEDEQRLTRLSDSEAKSYLEQ